MNPIQSCHYWGKTCTKFLLNCPNESNKHKSYVNKITHMNVSVLGRSPDGAIIAQSFLMAQFNPFFLWHSPLPQLNPLPWEPNPTSPQLNPFTGIPLRHSLTLSLGILFCHSLTLSPDTSSLTAVIKRKLWGHYSAIPPPAKWVIYMSWRHYISTPEVLRS